jgi:hypothetical protein
MTIDRTGGLSDGFIYAYWNFFFTCCMSGSFTRSTDGGQNYLQPIQFPQTLYWGTLSVGPTGELFVSGRDGNNDPFVLRSDNARSPGEIPTFEQATFVNLGGGLAFSQGPNPGGLLGQFDIETNHAPNELNGQVYLLASVNPSGPDPLDVMFARSEDGGLTWSEPVRVNNDPAAAGRYNWFGTMSVAPSGRIDVVWNDMRDDPNGLLSALYYSSSSDGGQTWTDNVQVSQQFNSLIGHPNQNKIGDYYDMRSTDDAAHVIYSATFNGEQDVYYLRIDNAEVLLGDVNRDGAVNLLDVAPFVLLLQTGAYQIEADINQDGFVNLADVSPFIDLLS